MVDDEEANPESPSQGRGDSAAASSGVVEDDEGEA